MIPRKVLVALVFALLLVLSCSTVHLQSARGSTGETNFVTNPGFEDSPCGAWTNTATIGGGVLKICNATTIPVPHSGTHVTLMNATQPDAQTKANCPPGAGCKDFVRATVQQFFPLGSTSPSLDSLSTSDSSFSVWWYVDPASYGMGGTYALHMQVQFRDSATNTVYSIEYWYGISDLSPPNVNLGPIPATGQWFHMTRNLSQDARLLNIPSPAVTRVDSILFGSYGNTTYGQNAYIDDASILFVPHPIPLFSSNPAVGQAPLTVSFNAGGTTETLGGPSITNFTWTFGDGTPAVMGTASSVRHTFINPGNYTVVLTVTDANLQSRSVSSKISVTGAPGDNLGLLGPAIAGVFALVLIAGLFFLRGRSHRKRPTGWYGGRKPTRNRS